LNGPLTPTYPERQSLQVLIIDSQGDRLRAEQYDVDVRVQLIELAIVDTKLIA
jgi:hypothetical protein